METYFPELEKKRKIAMGRAVECQTEGNIETGSLCHMSYREDFQVKTTM